MTKNKKWLMLGSLFTVTLAVIIGLSSQITGFTNNQSPVQSKIEPISPTNTLTEAEKDNLANLATQPLPIPSNTIPSVTSLPNNNNTNINPSYTNNIQPPIGQPIISNNVAQATINQPEPSITNNTKVPTNKIDNKPLQGIGPNTKALLTPTSDNNSTVVTTNQSKPTKIAVTPQENFSSGEKYPEEIPANNSISRKYHSIAQQTGYIETYPQLAKSIMGSSNGQVVVQDALNAFSQMRQAAAQDGISLRILSGFRGLQTQVGIFEGKGGGISAAQYSAPPGHSQHHTGLALDINSLSPSFRNTAAYRWLKRNAPSYGFMLSYENSQDDLGPKNEPWHWVYVKDPKAMRLMSCFITRARSVGYDPLQGDPELGGVYQQAISENSNCPA